MSECSHCGLDKNVCRHLANVTVCQSKCLKESRELAIAALVSAIYFRDSSDFKGALWDALRFLDNDAADLLYESDEMAYKKYVEVSEEKSITP